MYICINHTQMTDSRIAKQYPGTFSSKRLLSIMPLVLYRLLLHTGWKTAIKIHSGNIIIAKFLFLCFACLINYGIFVFLVILLDGMGVALVIATLLRIPFIWVSEGHAMTSCRHWPKCDRRALLAVSSQQACPLLVHVDRTTWKIKITLSILKEFPVYPKYSLLLFI